MPTSAEWEYACRAGTTTLFYSGDTVSFQDANFGDGGGRPDVGIFGRGDEKTKPPGRTTKVGSYAPNPWGLYDIHGNVVEWCQDYFDPDYYQLRVREDPQGPKTGYAFDPQARVVRGGSWWTRSNYNRSACRHPSKQIGGPGRIGFRVVCVVGAGSKKHDPQGDSKAQNTTKVWERLPGPDHGFWNAVVIHPTTGELFVSARGSGLYHSGDGGTT